MTDYSTEQERFWAGEFGDKYIDRNSGAMVMASNIALFSKVIARTSGISSVLEFGANVGQNLEVFRKLLPEVELSAIEINHQAAKILSKKSEIKIYQQSIIDFEPDYQRDLVLVKGVLIHQNPNFLNKIYHLLYNSCKKYICIAEYYNPTPVEISYRGHKGNLFKRDFAGELLDLFPDMSLIDYGFIYHRDINFPQDDLNWFLLEKTAP